MCGIAGYYGSRKLEPGILNAALKALQHRGPDGQGLYEYHTRTDKWVYLVHTRLAIIDLDAHANQPFCEEKHAFIFNGELYNYKELKATHLKTERFRTNSDTEVFLKLILNKNITQALDLSEGMWAFALFNEEDESLILSRDRFGEKPLYIYQDATGFYFASEIQALITLLPQGLKINHAKLATYLTKGYRALYKNTQTYFDGVELLEPASFLRLGSNLEKQKVRYWNPCFQPTSQGAQTEQQIIETVRTKLLKSLEIRLRSDVPIAFCMSGGVDSNTLISIAAKIFNYDVHGFTIQNMDAHYNEDFLVNESVRALGIKHNFVSLDKKYFLQNLHDIIRHRTSPIATISYYVHWLLLREISNNGYKVAVSGTGADELFTGYYDHFLLHLSSLQAASEQSYAGQYNEAKKNWEKHIKPVVRNPHFQDPEVFIKDQAKRDYLYSDYSAFKEMLHFNIEEHHVEQKFHPDGLRNRMLNELFYEVVPLILSEDDANAMNFSIENRSPFLDRQVFEFSLGIPTPMLIQDGYAKFVLRESMKGIIPEPIRNCRQKVGFNASLFELLDLESNTVAEQVFESSSPIYQIINRDKLQKSLKEKTMSMKFMFNFLSAQAFLEEFRAFV